MTVKLETYQPKQWVVDGVRYDDKSEAVERWVGRFLSARLHRDLSEAEARVVTLMMAYGLIKVEEVPA